MPFASNSTGFPHGVSVQNAAGTKLMGFQTLVSGSPTTTTDPALCTRPIGVGTDGLMYTLFGANWVKGPAGARAAGIATITGAATTSVIALGFAPAATDFSVWSLRNGAGSATTTVRGEITGGTNLTLTVDPAPAGVTSVQIPWAIW